MKKALWIIVLLLGALPSTVLASNYPYYHLSNIRIYVSNQDSHATPTHHVLHLFPSVYRSDGLENGYSLTETFINDSGRTIPNIWIKVITSKNVTIEQTFEGPLDAAHPNVFSTGSIQSLRDIEGGEFSDLYIFPLKTGPVFITMKFYENPQVQSTLMGSVTWRGVIR